MLRIALNYMQSKLNKWHKSPVTFQITSILVRNMESKGRKVLS